MPHFLNFVYKRK